MSRSSTPPQLVPPEPEKMTDNNNKPEEVVSKSKSNTIKTRWPEAAPLDGEELIFSISCGNSHLHWSTHFGSNDDYNPSIFWRTPHLKNDDTNNEDLIAVLSRNLPDDPHDYIFGKSSDATSDEAIVESKKRSVPLISVYVVSTNSVQEGLLAKLWATVPSRYFVMKGDDFFTKEAGRYDSMGTDRLATLTGAVHLHGHPALVFDGGTATTYSATDSAGTILGGGIGPGIQSKFRSLTKDTDALPEITAEEVIQRVNDAQENAKPLPTFARNTREAMMADAFQEFALKGKNVIEHWLEKAYHNKDPEAIAIMMKVNDEHKIVCTGGDGDILMQLLQPHYGGVIEQAANNKNSQNNESSEKRYVVEQSKHLIHYGIASVLAAQVSARKKKDELARYPDAEYIGKRVAKHFPEEDDEGDNIFRGKVVKIVEDKGGETSFNIKYDDGDGEDVPKSELLEMFKLYVKFGEKKAKRAVGRPKKKNAKKEKASAEVAKSSNTVVPEKVKSAAQKVASKQLDVEEEKDTRKKPIDIPSFPMKDKSKEKSGNAKKPAAKKKASTTIAKKPAAKRAKKIVIVPDFSAIVNGTNPNDFVRKRVGKEFDGKTYFGTIMLYDDSEHPAFWHVEYDDGDEEDYSKKDLMKALKKYDKDGHKDPNKV